MDVFLDGSKMSNTARINVGFMHALLQTSMLFFILLDFSVSTHNGSSWFSFRGPNDMQNQQR